MKRSISLMLIFFLLCTSFTGMFPVNIVYGASANNITWTNNHNSTRDPLSAIAYGNNIYVAVGSEGTILTSSDGNTWNRAESGTINDLYGIAWTGSKFFAVGRSGTVVSSSDGVNWSYNQISSIAADNNYLLAVSWNGSKLVAVGSSGLVVTSSDGVNWSKQSLSPYKTLRCVTWAKDKFVASGDRGTIFTSLDGVTWTQRVSNSTPFDWEYYLDDIVWDGSKFIIPERYGYISRILTSPDGVNWTEDKKSYEKSFIGALYNEGKYFLFCSNNSILAAGNGTDWSELGTTPVSIKKAVFAKSQYVGINDSGYICVSSDGLSWRIVKSGVNNSYYGAAYGNDKFVVVGEYGTLLTSADGVNWSKKESGTNYKLRKVIWNGKEFIAVGNNGVILKSLDGEDWQKVESGINLDIGAVIWTGTKFVAVAYKYASNGIVAILSSVDGTSWTYDRQLLGSFWMPEAESIAYNGDIYVISIDNQMYTSTDCVQWTKRDSGTTNHIYDIAWSGDKFIAVDRSNANSVSSDGVSWKWGYTPNIDNLRCIKNIGTNILAVGEDGQISISPDGTNWSQFNDITSRNLYAVASNGNKLIAVGEDGIIISGQSNTSSTISAAGVKLNKSKLDIAMGSSETLAATVLPSNAANKSVYWVSSDPSIAKVDRSGKVTAVGAGSAKIAAVSIDGNISGQCDVNVVDRSIHVTGVVLNKNSSIIQVNSSEVLTATIFPYEASNKNITWASSDSQVASVDQSGRVTALKTGTARITATTQDGSKTDFCDFTVNPVQIDTTGVTLNKSILNLSVGQEENLFATVTPENATNKNVSWVSSDRNVAEVDDNGRVTAVSAGTAAITVKTGDGINTAVCLVIVGIPVSGIYLDKTSLSIPVFGSETLSATIEPENATEKKVIWNSSDENVAVVDQTGRITGFSEGNGKITATTLDGSKTAVCDVKVYPSTVFVDSVTLNKSTLILDVGSTEVLIPTINPSNATNKAISWSSSNEKVATVDETGKVTAAGEGTATIKVITSDGFKMALCNITVSPIVVHVSGVTLDKSNASISIGSTVTLTAVVAPENASNKNIIWSSDNPSVASVDQWGKVTGITSGETLITAASVDGLKPSNCRITVNSANVAATGVSLNRTRLEIEKGGVGLLNASIYPENATDKSLTWSSDNPDVVTVDQSGKVTAKDTGMANVTVKTIDGSYSAECIVSVVNIDLENVDFSENNMITHTSNNFSDGFDRPLDGGGNSYIATAYLARWGGVVTEKDDPYPSTLKSSDIKIRDKNPQRHVQEVLFLPKRSSLVDLNDVKKSLMNYGAVQAAIYWDNSYYSTSSFGFYNNEYTKTNHAITIVGWDDNFNKSNFKVTPPGNGAFICKNSWGAGFGQKGFFYVSYYDKTIGDYCAVFNNSEPVNNYDYIYQYDPLGVDDTIGYNEDTAYFANVFEAKNSDSEELAAVSFYTLGENAKYEILYCTDYNGIDSLASLKTTGQKGVIDMPGYHTIRLNKTIKLTKGKKFAVAVKLTVPGSTEPICIERPFNGYSSYANANPGESFVSRYGSYWEDINLDSSNQDSNSNVNVCLKAFTINNSDLSSTSLQDITQNSNTSNLGKTNALNIFSNNLDFNNDGSNNTTEEYSLGDTPIPIKIIKFNPFGDTADNYPETYDLRGLSGITPVRDQGAIGSCWAHAAYGSLESNFKLQNHILDTALPQVIGDLDGDSIITINDAEIIKAYLLEKITDDSSIMLSNGDVDSDGKITSSDYALILRYVSGEISSFPGTVDK